jgi:hypothetical protein
MQSTTGTFCNKPTQGPPLTTEAKSALLLPSISATSAPRWNGAWLIAETSNLESSLLPYPLGCS